MATTKQTKQTKQTYFVNDTEVYFNLKGRCKKNEVMAIVSIDKWESVSAYDWYLGKSGYPICYQLSKMTLHRFIFTLIVNQKIPQNLYVDHIDRNKLNNTNENLRLVTPMENSFNKSTKSNTKGVKKVSENNYTACVCKNGTKHQIKNIKTEKEAASIYNLMAEELFGDYAAPNCVN